MKLLVEDLTVSYAHHAVVHQVCCCFEAGSMWAICGPNGAGKSTLLKSIMGLIRPDSGKIIWQNTQRADLAYLPQQADIDRSQPMSVYELAAMGLWYEIGFFGGVSAAQHARVRHALDRVGMADFAKRPIGHLSNGQFQRVLFARMLVQDAHFLLLDEPFNAIDARTTAELLQVLQQCHAEGRAIIAVLHDYEQVQAHFPHTLLLARETIAAGASCDIVCANSPHLQAANAAMLERDGNDWCRHDAG